jgi:hypothetical protein
MENHDSEKGQNSGNHDSSQPKRLVSDGSFPGLAAELHAGGSRTPSPVHRIIDEDSYFSDMILDSKNGKNERKSVINPPTKPRERSMTELTVKRERDDGFPKKVPLELPKQTMELRNISGSIEFPLEKIHETVTEERQHAQQIRHEEIKRKILMEKENELKHGPRTTIIAARRATGSVANLTRKFVGLSTTV